MFSGMILICGFASTVPFPLTEGCAVFTNKLVYPTKESCMESLEFGVANLRAQLDVTDQASAYISDAQCFQLNRGV